MFLYDHYKPDGLALGSYGSLRIFSFKIKKAGIEFLPALALSDDISVAIGRRESGRSCIAFSFVDGSVTLFILC